MAPSSDEFHISSLGPLSWAPSVSVTVATIKEISWNVKKFDQLLRNKKN